MSYGVCPIFHSENFENLFCMEGSDILCNIDFLDEIACKYNVTPISSFDSTISDIPDDFDGDPSEFELPPEEWTWFEAIDGVRTLQVILEVLHKDSKVLSEDIEVECLIKELENLMLALKKAHEENVKFILTVL